MIQLKSLGGVLPIIDISCVNLRIDIDRIFIDKFLSSVEKKKISFEYNSCVM